MVDIDFRRPSSFNSGVAGIMAMFNAIRLACLYMSPAAIDKVLEHYRKPTDSQGSCRISWSTPTRRRGGSYST